jgi:hypothetical protein
MVQETVLDALRGLGARVTLMLSDFSPARADAVRALNAARIPVVGILTCLAIFGPAEA